VDKVNSLKMVAKELPIPYSDIEDIIAPYGPCGALYDFNDN